MIHRHLDVPEGTPVGELGLAAIDDLLDRGDLADWQALLNVIAQDPFGQLASKVLRLCEAHEMYGTSLLWKGCVEHRRSRQATDAAEVSLSELRRSRGITQVQLAERLGVSQSDVSKLERRADVRISTLKAVVEALGGELELVAVFRGSNPITHRVRLS